MITVGSDGRPRKEYGQEAFLTLMVDEGRLVCEFDIERTYGML